MAWLRRTKETLADRIIADADLTGPRVAMVAAALYAAFSVAHALVLVGSTRAIMVSIAAASVVAIIACILLHAQQKMPSQVLLMVVLSIATLNSIAHMAITGDPRQTTNFMLLLIAVGFFVLEVQLMGALSIALFAAWLFVMPRDLDEFTHYIFAILTALLLGITMGVIRRRMLDPNEA